MLDDSIRKRDICRSMQLIKQIFFTTSWKTNSAPK